MARPDPSSEREPEVLIDLPPQGDAQAAFGAVQREGWRFASPSADAPLRRHPDCVDALTAHFNLVAREAKQGRWRFQRADTFKADAFWFTARYEEAQGPSGYSLLVKELALATAQEVLARGV